MFVMDPYRSEYAGLVFITVLELMLSSAGGNLPSLSLLEGSKDEVTSLRGSSPPSLPRPLLPSPPSPFCRLCPTLTRG